MEKENNNNSPLIITIILLMVAFIGSCIYIIYDKTKDEENNKKETQPDTTVKETKVIEISLDEINKKNNDVINAFKQLIDNSDKVLYIYYDEVTDAEINNAGFRGTYDYVDMTPSRTFTKDAFIVVKEGNSIKVLDTDENALATFNISDATMDIKRIELLEKDSEFKSESGSTEKGLYIYASDANRDLTIYYYNPDTNETTTEQSELSLQI